MPRWKNTKSTAEDFWSRVDKSSGDCWIWEGYKDDGGYGNVGRSGKTLKAHRVAWELTYGEVPDDMCVLHHCDNPPCVRPDHLFLGTDADNVRDMNRKGRGVSPHGEDNGRSKLTWNDVVEIRRRYTKGNITQRELAKEYNMAPSSIANVIMGNHWRAPQ